jgi:tRNA A37 threonylcarbamoyltransferase TsaD
MMGLGYPGGPVISKLASEYLDESTKLFPRVYLEKS